MSRHSIRRLFTGLVLIFSLVFLVIACSEQETPVEQPEEVEDVLPDEEGAQPEDEAAQPEETDGAQPNIHGEVSLPGSDFEIDEDANLKNDDGGSSIDWEDVNEIRQEDQPSGPK